MHMNRADGLLKEKKCARFRVPSVPVAVSADVPIACKRVVQDSLPSADYFSSLKLDAVPLFFKSSTMHWLA